MSNKIVYTFSEAYGPLPCEFTVDGKPCGAESWCALIDEKEFLTVPVDPILRPRFILENGVGLIVCDQHGGV